METEKKAEKEVQMKTLAADLRVEMVKVQLVKLEGTQKKGLEVEVAVEARRIREVAGPGVDCTGH